MYAKHLHQLFCLSHLCSGVWHIGYSIANFIIYYSSHSLEYYHSLDLFVSFYVIYFHLILVFLSFCFHSIFHALVVTTFSLLGVRSLANASRARQFNPLNPPGVGWVNFFVKVRVSIRTCVPNLGAVRRERFLTIYNPLNSPGMGWRASCQPLGLTM